MLDERIDQRSQVLENLGLGLYDAFHIACAEFAEADILLTTDDRLLKRAARHTVQIQVKLSNPVTWLINILSTQEGQDDDTY
jgi:predicted nucleic acid-binding protein